MKPRREKWLEKLVTKKMKSVQACRIVDCAQEYITAYGISKMSREKEDELFRLIRRIKRRVKQRMVRYNFNLRTLQNQVLIPVELIYLLEELKIIDLNKTVQCHNLIRFTHYRDFCISRDLQGYQIPDDPTIPMHKWI